jgi:hypothetical protein
MADSATPFYHSLSEWGIFRRSSACGTYHEFLFFLMHVLSLYITIIGYIPIMYYHYTLLSLGTYLSCIIIMHYYHWVCTYHVSSLYITIIGYIPIMYYHYTLLSLGTYPSCIIIMYYYHWVRTYYVLSLCITIIGYVPIMYYHYVLLS